MCKDVYRFLYTCGPTILLRRRDSLYSLFVMVSNVGEVFSSLPIYGIGETGMIAIELRAVRQDLIGELIEIAYSPREPRYRVDIVFVISENATVSPFPPYLD